MTTRQQQIFQIIWGCLLMIAGVGMFFRIPQVMPEIAQIDAFSSALLFIRFSFYMIGCLLTGGGMMKIRKNYKLLLAGNNDQ